MANNIIGAHGSIGAGSMWNTDESQPHWNTATMAPYAAPIETRFNTTAFSGTSRLRNTASSSKKLTIRTAAMNHGSRAPMNAEKSMPEAV